MVEARGLDQAASVTAPVQVYFAKSRRGAGKVIRRRVLLAHGVLLYRVGDEESTSVHWQAN